MKKHYVIIPAAGLATRLRPISNAMSKAMVPVAGKPILAHILSALDENKVITDVVVVTGENNDIERFLEHKTYNNIKISCTKQVDHTGKQSAKGPLEAVFSGISYIFNNSVFDSDSLVTVWLGDTLLTDKKGITNMLKMNHKPWAACSHVNDWSRWCMAELVNSRLVMYDKPIEKPPTSNALIGIYHLGNIYTAAENVMYSMAIQRENESFELAPLLEQYHDIVLPEVTDWIDAGDLPSLHEANAKLINTKARDFNHVYIDGQTVIKNTTIQEVNWYLDVWNKYPAARKIIPAVYNTNGNKIQMEMCSGTNLQDMLVYDNIREECWDFIIKRVITEYNNAFSMIPNGSITDAYDMSLEPMFYGNIITRLDSLVTSGLLSVNDFNVLQAHHQKVWHKINEYNTCRQNYNMPCIHGDFHFGNIIYDATVNKVKAIDPRGKWNGVNTTAGNVLYDMAKLYQSVYAEYAWIEAGEPVNCQSKEVVLSAIDKHIKIIIKDDTLIDMAKKFSAILLASAVPLHSDNPKRQERMIKTALRILQ